MGRPKRKLTEPQIDLLNRLYYGEKLKVGRDKLWRYLRSKYPEAKISRRLVADYLELQPVNQVNRRIKKRITIQSLHPTSIRQFIYVDLVDMSVYKTHSGMRWMFNCIDAYSKFGWSQAMPNKNNKTVLNTFKKMYKEIGYFKVFRADQGSEFTNRSMINFLKSQDIKPVFSQPYTPQSNLTERFNQTIKRIIIRNIDDGYRQWDEYLQQIVYFYNNTYHTGIKMTPAEADSIGKSKLLTERIMKSSKQQKKSKINVGDYVRLANREKQRRGRYELNYSREVYVVWKKTNPRLTTTAPRFYLKNLETGKKLNKVYYETDLLKIPKNTDLSLLKVPEYYVVNKILKRQKFENGIFYLLQYRGLSRGQKPVEKWVYENDPILTEDIPKMVEQFNKKRNK